MAGAPCPVQVMRQVIDKMHMREVTIAYGMTETSPVSFQSCIDDPIEARVSTVGSVHPHVEVKIIDPPTGLTLPRGQAGELCTRGYVVMLGYWNDPESTTGAIDTARWMHSGDLAVNACRWPCQYRRPPERHDHPRRREYLSSRDRRVSAYASQSDRAPRGPLNVDLFACARLQATGRFALVL